MKREEKRKWICLTYAGVYPSTKRSQTHERKIYNLKTQKTHQTQDLSPTLVASRSWGKIQNLNHKQSIGNTKWVVNRQMPEMKWNEKHTFLGWWVVEPQRGGAQQRASEPASGGREETILHKKTRTRRDTLRSGRRQTEDPPPQLLSCIQLYSLQANHILGWN